MDLSASGPVPVLSSATRVYQSKDDNMGPWISGSGQTLYFSSSGSGTNSIDIFFGSVVNGTVTNPSPIDYSGPVNTPLVERDPWLSDDGLELLFARGNSGSRPSQRQPYKLYRALRSSLTAPFAQVDPLGISTATPDSGTPTALDDTGPFLLGNTLYFSRGDISGRSGARAHIYTAQRVCKPGSGD